tara:strand:+ start:397 stop:582 length:186 start_codon:yes stop_codon:yes gene_type:complete
VEVVQVQQRDLEDQVELAVEELEDKDQQLLEDQALQTQVEVAVELQVVVLKVVLLEVVDQE